MAALEQWVSGHEALCAERYGGLKSDLRWLIRGVFGILIAMVAYLTMQLLGTFAHNTAAPPVTVMQSQAPAPLHTS